MSAEDLLCDAQDAYFDGNVPEAVRLCRAALEADDMDVEVYKFLVSCLVSLDQFDDGTHQLPL